MFNKITEQSSLHDDLDKKSVEELLTEMNEEDQKVPLAVKAAIPQITKLVEEIVPRMKKGGRIFYIEVSYENLCERLKRDTRRPLLQVENRNEVIKELLDKRLPLYRAAASVYVNGNFSSTRVANNILSILRY